MITSLHHCRVENTTAFDLSNAVLRPDMSHCPRTMEYVVTVCGPALGLVFFTATATVSVKPNTTVSLHPVSSNGISGI